MEKVHRAWSVKGIRDPEPHEHPSAGRMRGGGGSRAGDCTNHCAAGCRDDTQKKRRTDLRAAVQELLGHSISGTATGEEFYVHDNGGFFSEAVGDSIGSNQRK